MGYRDSISFEGYADQHVDKDGRSVDPQECLPTDLMDQAALEVAQLGIVSFYPWFCRLVRPWFCRELSLRKKPARLTFGFSGS